MDDTLKVRWIVVSMYAGLALSVLGAAVPLVTGDLIADHVAAVYAGYLPAAEVEGSAGFLTYYLVGVGILGAVSWLVHILAIRKRQGWVRWLGTVVFLSAAGLSVMNLTVTEYGRVVFPPSMAVVALLPCVVGLVTMVLLWSWRPVRAAIG